MTITSVSSSTFLADAVNLIRDKLRDNITDPIAAKRPANSKFALTEYPNRPAIYPILTIVDRDITQPQRLGMGSESTSINLTLEIRVWARNVKERDELFDAIYDYLRNDQLDSGTGLVASNLSGFTLLSALNVSESGEAGIKSKVMEVQFLFIAE